MRGRRSSGINHRFLKARTVTFLQSGGTEVSPADINKKQRGRPNCVHTTRYTLLSWLPLSLYAQFQQVANVYFAVVCTVIFALPNAAYPWQPTCLTFVAMTLFTAFMDGLEDLGRKKDDRTVNSEPCWRYNPSKGAFEQVQCCTIVCGDIVFVNSGSAFPADLKLLYVPDSLPMYLSSANLDGETSWKLRKTAFGLCEAMRARFVATRKVPPAWYKPKAVDHEAAVSWFLTMVSSKASQIIKESPPPREALDVLSTLFSPGPWGTTTTLQAGPPTSSVWDSSASLFFAASPADCASRGRFRLPSDALLPRGCILQGEGWALAVAAYVGEETKTRLNSTKPRAKRPVIQKKFNKCLKGVIFAIFTVVFTFWGLRCRREFEWSALLQWFIVLYWIVPIGVYVCVDFLLLSMASVINNDPLMGAPEKPAKVRTTQTICDLGQVTHIFSDKTGTLTENNMRLARACVSGGQDLGEFRQEQDSCLLPPGIERCRRLLSSSHCAPEQAGETEPARLLFFCMAVCNSLQVRICSDGAPRYSGASPEESAMAMVASTLGVSLVCRKPNSYGVDHARVQMGDGADSVVSYRVVHSFAFSSDRKRMSIVFQNVDDADDCWCVVKGADNVVGELLAEPLGNSDQHRLTEYATEGLRTLLIAYRRLSRGFLAQLEADLEAVYATEIQGDGKAEHVESAFASLAAQVERDLQPAGVVAIEDPLHAGVSDTICAVREAGVKFWMLTGDKTETATSIAQISGIFSRGVSTLLATTENMRAIQREEFAGSHVPSDMNRVIHAWLNRSLQSVRVGGVVHGLVIDGTVFRHVTEDQALGDLLYILSRACEACVCTRLSPQQKRYLVEMIRKRDQESVTLAIGDGGNDVPMITAAHVGVGIHGKEGMQAMQASDYAVYQFQDILPLMLVHGRQNLWRVASSASFYIYRHVALAVGPLHYALYKGFEPMQVFPTTLIVVYPMVMTAPNWFFWLLAKDKEDHESLASPHLYLGGPRGDYFNAKVFLGWIALGFFHGSLSWMMPFYGILHAGGRMGATDDTQPDDSEEFWQMSLISIFANIWIVCVQNVLQVRRHRKFLCIMVCVLSALVAMAAAQLPDTRLDKISVVKALTTPQLAVWIFVPTVIALASRYTVMSALSMSGDASPDSSSRGAHGGTDSRSGSYDVDSMVELVDARNVWSR